MRLAFSLFVRYNIIWICAPDAQFALKGTLMKIFRSVLALALSAALLLLAVGCGYSPVKSTEEEREPVLVLDGAYEVPYELYRFYFLSELSLSGEDPAALDGAAREALFADLNAKAVEELAAVYAVFSFCKKYGIDYESREFDGYVKDGVISAVEGDDTYLGYGDHETYLAEIKKAYMNDSVFRFLLRYRYAESALAAQMRDGGHLSAEEATVLEYMRGEECRRASWIYIPYTMLPNYTDASLAEKEAAAKAASDEEFLALTHTVVPDTYTDEQLDTGFYIGRYQLDPYYAALTETVFSLEVGETSGWIDSGDGVYLVRRLPKEEGYLSDAKNLADFTEYYLLNTFYGLLAAESARIALTVSYTEAHAALSFDRIRMPE